MNKIFSDVAVVGGGACGIACAIIAARNKCRVVVIEKNSRIGKKLLVTGNGRCNIFNTHITTDSYNYSAEKFLSDIFSKYQYNVVKDFFSSMGLILKTEPDGRVYPFCGQASSVLDILRMEMARLGVKEICDFNTEYIEKTADGFRIVSECCEIVTKKLVVASGGKAFYPDNDSKTFSIAKGFGHSVTKVFPALVPVLTRSGFEKSLKGSRNLCTISLVADETVIKKESGEIQFTQTGLSGICVFQLSRLIGEFFNLHTINGTKYKNITLTIDLLPGVTTKNLIDILNRRVAKFHRLSIDQLCTGIISKKVAMCVLKSCGVINLCTPMSSVRGDTILKIAKSIKSWRFVPVGLAPFKDAQVMSGGVSLKEISPYTMESLKTRGVYFCGEILDIDGDCGGFNLYWAWLSGIIAGNGASKSL